jgi:hypothetical protein
MQMNTKIISWSAEEFNRGRDLFDLNDEDASLSDEFIKIRGHFYDLSNINVIDAQSSNIEKADIQNRRVRYGLYIIACMFSVLAAVLSKPHERTRNVTLSLGLAGLIVKFAWDKFPSLQYVETFVPCPIEYMMPARDHFDLLIAYTRVILRSQYSRAYNIANDYERYNKLEPAKQAFLSKLKAVKKDSTLGVIEPLVTSLSKLVDEVNVILSKYKSKYRYDIEDGSQFRDQEAGLKICQSFYGSCDRFLEPQNKAFPKIPMMKLSELEERFPRPLVELLRDMVKYRSRNHTYSLGTVYDTRGLWEMYALSKYPVYTEIETGQYGTYLFPIYEFNVGVKRRDFMVNNAYHTLVFGVDHTDPLSYQTSQFLYEFSPNEGLVQSGHFGIMNAAVQRPFQMGIIPIYIKGVYGSAYNAPFYTFNTDTLRGISVGEWVDSFYSLSLDLPFSIHYGMKINVFNFFLLRGFAGSFFLENGNGWTRTDNSDVALQNSKTCAGIEFNMLWSTMADLTIPLTIGYGFELNGDPHQNEIYFSINSPLSMHAQLFGY